NRGVWDFITIGDVHFVGTTSATFLNEPTGQIIKTGFSTGTSSFDADIAVDMQGTAEVYVGALQIGSLIPQVAGSELAGGTWIVHADATLTLSAYGDLTSNAATVVLDGPNSVFTNLAALADNSGSLSLLDGRVFTAVGSFGNTGELRLGPAARLDAIGGFTNDTTGTVVVEIADRPGTGLYGQLAAAGTADLAGTLDIDLVGGFVPVVTDLYDVVLWTSRTGGFDDIVDLAPRFTDNYLSDRLQLEAIVPTCNGLPVTVDLALGQVPTAGNDVILGTPDADVIDGLEGDDTICGMGGDDTINGGLGLDDIFGAEGVDTIDGGKGNDRIRGGPGADDLYGGGGGDRIWGEDGNDIIRGGNGNDRLYGGPGADEIRGQNGSDLVYANDAVDFSPTDPDTIYGGGLYDRLTGDFGDDIIYGGNFADVLAGKAGDDQLYGNNGTDTLRGGPHLVGDYCNGGTINSGTGDTATACETVINVP
ncbi:MAG: hypothetical protein QNJ12_16840, partial [Ilumatobacter sp.]|uniref:calcium-binding protein n=1 Tax=Ilumatobacter sp. TaxID=1967498 RepID=UPI002A55A677|nr:hypothetical protein [Ilumatobacter sp.]